MADGVSGSRERFRIEWWLGRLDGGRWADFNRADDTGRGHVPGSDQPAPACHGGGCIGASRCTGCSADDVRPTHMFNEGHIPWAVNLPWAQNLGEDGTFLPAEALLAHFERHGVTPESNVIMHCQVGLTSTHSYVALRLLGFRRVRVYHRSWAEWGNDPALPKVTS